MQVAEQTSHQIPLEIAAIIVDYVAEDVTTLKNLTLTSRDFCTLCQARIFSTVLLDGNAKRDRLIFFEDLLNGDRGQIIAGHIKNLYLLFCDDWFAEEEEEEVIELTHELEHGETDNSEQGLAEREHLSPEPSTMADDSSSELAFGTMIEFIAQHAGGLRCIHIGPFSEIHLDWHDISHNVRNAITHLLVCAEEIALEGFANIPIALFQSLQNLKSLDVAHVIPSRSSYSPPPSIPSPTSLAIHPGINGSARNSEEMWDMTSFLRNMTLGGLLNFSNLTTLSLHLLYDPIKYPMIKHLLALCSNSLRTLRLYIWERNAYDSNVIDFSQLLALQSLTLVTDLSGVGSSLQYLSEAINTISTQQLNDLTLAIDTEDRFRDWTMEFTLAMQSTPDPWEALLQTKISQILRGSNIRIAFEFPPLPLPRPVLQPEEVFTAIGYILDVDNMESAVKERLTFTIQEVSIKNAFTLRTKAEIRSANLSAPKPPLFGNSPYYGWNMFVDITEAHVGGDDETIPE